MSLSTVERAAQDDRGGCEGAWSTGGGRGAARDLCTAGTRYTETVDSRVGGRRETGAHQ